MTQIPSRYLNNNVKAMISGGNPVSVSLETKTYVLQLFRIFSWFKKKYKVEVLVSKED
jgi:hypothetical protein